MHKDLRLLLSEKANVQQKLHKLQKKVKRHLGYANQHTTGVKKHLATTTANKRDIMSFFKAGKDSTSPSTSSSSAPVTDGNESNDTLILSSGDEDEANAIKKIFIKDILSMKKLERSIMQILLMKRSDGWKVLGRK